MPGEAMEALERLAGVAAAVTGHIERALGEDRDLLGEISLYSLYGGGKRLRPAVFALAWEILGGGAGDMALSGASVFELIHMASLIHDDIVDSSDTRRGRRAAHLQFGVPEAVLAGDYLVAKAATVCLEFQHIPFFRRLVTVIRELSYGELFQLKARRDPTLDREGYMAIIMRKTASLLSACAESPAIILGSPDGPREALRDYGERYGTSFQMADDVLDYRGEAGALGKPVLKDLDEGRITLPLIIARDALPEARSRRLTYLAALAERSPDEKAELLALVDEGGGVEGARAEAARYADGAVAALAAFPESPARECLAALARMNVIRES